MPVSDAENFVFEFEKAWSNYLANREQTEPPDLDNFAPATESPGYAEILVELVRVDLEFYWHMNQAKDIDSYRQRFPEIFKQEKFLEPLAFEEYRLRVQGGQAVSPQDYADRLKIETRHWPRFRRLTESKFASSSSDRRFHDNSFQGSGEFDDRATLPKALSRISGVNFSHSSKTKLTLRRRLLFVGIVFSILLIYLAVLVLTNPVSKVGWFLGSDLLVMLNTVSLFGCLSITVLLWIRPLSLFGLRTCELLLFGLLLLELSAGLFSDLFVDHELLEPLAEGDHELFHYASSWSLPFFALIVSYGILIPSSWLRCIIIVSVMSLVPIAICFSAAVAEQGTSLSFFQSFLLQMAMWMAIAATIAVYGVHRIESLERELAGKVRIGNYQITSRIAHGGMGEIYKARHVYLQRDCAIKFIRTDLTYDEKFLARFEREVQVLAGLSHPHVVQIFDFGHTDGGTFYYVMEFLEGQDLTQHVESQSRIDPNQALLIMEQICAAVIELHNFGLVHRDLKPSNIFLTSNDLNDESERIAKLLDFGLVKVSEAADEPDLTHDGTIIGTPAFMSPEQATGEGVDHRTDIYSFGAVFYFLLAGEPPFVRSSIVETLNAQIWDRVIPIQVHRPEIPPAMAELIHQCLAKDPQQRLENFNLIATEIQQLKTSQ